jgi:parallel beta-helix repeat protein
MDVASDARRLLRLLLLILALAVTSPLGTVAQEASPVPSPPAALASPVATPTPAAVPAANCQDAWRDDVQARTLTLSTDCVTTRPLTVPPGWTLDGGGHSIFAAPSFDSDLGEGIVTVKRGSGAVRDLTIDGAALERCREMDRRKDRVGLMVINASVDISGVTVQHLNWPPTTPPPPDPSGVTVAWEPCGTGILVWSGRATIEDSVVRHVGASGIQVDEAEASISNTIIDQAAETGIEVWYGSGVRIAPGNHISNGAFGIRFSGDGTSGRIAGNTIEAMTEAGISIAFGAQASIADNTIAASGAHGIVVERPETRATLESNQISGGDIGIAVKEAATADLAGNRIAGTTSAGIELASGSRTTVSAQTIARPGREGIRIDGPDTSAIVRDSMLSEAQEAGVRVQRGAAAAIGDGNDISDGQWGIVVIDPGASALVSGNRVTDAAYQGIGVLAGARATIENNAVSGGDTAILIQDPGRAAVVRNTIDDAVTVGISLERGAELSTDSGPASAPEIVVRACEAEDTARTLVIPADRPVRFTIPYTTGTMPQRLRVDALGISLDLPPSDVSAEAVVAPAGTYDYTCGPAGQDEPVWTGTLIAAGHSQAGDVVQGNTLHGGQWGIAVLSTSASASISGNTVSGTRLIGIVVEGTSAAISDNRLENSRSTGIKAGPVAEVEIRDNVIRGGTAPPGQGGPYGIDLYPDVRGIISGNEIVNHVNPDPVGVACGIVLAVPPPPVEMEANVFPEPGNEIDVCDPFPATPVASPAVESTPVA